MSGTVQCLATWSTSKRSLVQSISHKSKSHLKLRHLIFILQFLYLFLLIFNFPLLWKINFHWFLYILFLLITSDTTWTTQSIADSIRITCSTIIIITKVLIITWRLRVTLRMALSNSIQALIIRPEKENKNNKLV